MTATIATEQTKAERHDRDFPKITRQGRVELEFKPKSESRAHSLLYIHISCVPSAKPFNLSEPFFPHAMSERQPSHTIIVQTKEGNAQESIL